MFEIYKSFAKKPKTYIVATRPNEKYENIMPYAKKFFRCSEAHIEVVDGWILNGELYLEDPGRKAKKRTIAFYC